MDDFDGRREKVRELAIVLWGDTAAYIGSVGFDGEEWYFWHPGTGDRHYVEWIDENTPRFAGDDDGRTIEGIS